MDCSNRYRGVHHLVAGVVMLTPASVLAEAAGDAHSSSGERISTEVPTGFFDVVFAGGWVGFGILLLLLALSLTAAYLVFEHLITIRRPELMPDGLGEKVRGLLKSGRINDATVACRARPSFLSFVLLNGIAEIEGGK